MLFAQATDGFNLFENGVSIGFLTIGVAAGVYILRRMLNEKNGLVPMYVSKTTDTMESIANTCQQQAETATRQEQYLRDIKESQARIEIALTQAIEDSTAD